MRHRSISPDTGTVSGYWNGCSSALRKRLAKILFLAAVSLVATLARAVTPQDLLAHPPTNYFNDYAGIIQSSSAAYLNDALATFVRGAGPHEISGWAALAILIFLLLFPVGIVFLAFRFGHMHRVRGSTGTGIGGHDAASSSDSGSSSGSDSDFSGGGGDSGGGGASGDW
jgi:uncharacterized membrane protein YgcG